MADEKSIERKEQQMIKAILERKHKLDLADMRLKITEADALGKENSQRFAQYESQLVQKEIAEFQEPRHRKLARIKGRDATRMDYLTYKHFGVAALVAVFLIGPALLGITALLESTSLLMWAGIIILSILIWRNKK